MEGYQKYLFDNFIIEDKKISKDSEEETVYQDNSEEIIDAAVDVFAAEDVEPEKNELIEEPLIFPQQTVETIAENIETETKIIENTTVEPSYSKEDLDLAIKEAEERGYQEGLEAAKQDVLTQQNVLLDEVRNQLMTIFADIDNKASQVELEALKFAVKALRKVLPTLEKERAEAEIKQFLSDNFANFSAQDTLSFAFNPDSIALVASSIGRLAEQNDFEGKISVHKDTSLGIADCRVEWKSGGVEHRTKDIMDKIENLIDDKQEREND